jgi:hypothetical protein
MKSTMPVKSHVPSKPAGTHAKTVGGATGAVKAGGVKAGAGQGDDSEQVK